jgi:hypothetical protein
VLLIASWQSPDRRHVASLRPAPREKWKVALQFASMTAERTGILEHAERSGTAHRGRRMRLAARPADHQHDTSPSFH